MSSFDSASTLNIPHARSVLRFLRENPDKHNQNHYGLTTACGTTACIAGTAVMLDPSAKYGFDVEGAMQMNAVTETVWGRAKWVLGLTADDADELFYDFDDASALDRLASWIEEAEAMQ